MPTAAIIVIGDEVLSAKVRDENSPWLAERLRGLGIDLQRIHVIPDEIDVIADTVRTASEGHDLVFTSGGVGPTHDDLTMAGIAAAFGTGLWVHPELDALLESRMGEDYNPAAQQMATIPTDAQLLWLDGMFFPQVIVENVYIFPGVPFLLRKKFDAIADRLEGTPLWTATLLTTARETRIAAQLSTIQTRWPQVTIGSYPQYEHKPYTVKVILDSSSQSAILEAFTALETALSNGLVSTVAPSSTRAAEPVETGAISDQADRRDQ